MRKIKGLSLNKPGEIFLCGNCLNAMCEDCISMADEYQYRDHQLKLAAYEAGEAIIKLKAEQERLIKELGDWKRFVNMAYPDVIAKWIASQVTQ